MKLMSLKKQHIWVDGASRKNKRHWCKMDVKIWLNENSSLLNWVGGINR
jgi:hypothetical protein